jgi:Xaa-Pro aminopeptidase
MRYTSFNKEFFTGNRARLLAMVQPGSVVVLNANDQTPRSGDQLFSYRQNSDLYYLTGIEQEKTMLVLCPDHPDSSMKEVLFIMHASPEQETWEGKKLSKEEAEEISGVKNIYWLDDFERIFRDQVIHSETIYLNTYEYVKFKTEVTSRDARFIEWVKEKYPLHRMERVAPLITSLRMIKEPEEMKAIQKAVDITGMAFERILKFLRPGVFEYQVEAEMTHEFLWNGAIHGFLPIIASGKNACYLHYCVNHDLCREGDLLLIDFGAEYANYSADCTRTIPVNGKFSKRQAQLYESVLRILRQAIDIMVPGKTLKELNQQIHEISEKEHIDLGLYTREEWKKQDPKNPLRAKYLPHGVSHHIGLDVHDLGSLHFTLKPGMVLTCEPGIYMVDEGIGIRIEDDILITEAGPVNLMKKFPVDIADIERIMTSRK